MPSLNSALASKLFLVTALAPLALAFAAPPLTVVDANGTVVGPVQSTSPTKWFVRDTVAVPVRVGPKILLLEVGPDGFKPPELQPQFRFRTTDCSKDVYVARSAPLADDLFLGYSLGPPNQTLYIHDGYPNRDRLMRSMIDQHGKCVPDNAVYSVIVVIPVVDLKQRFIAPFRLVPSAEVIELIP